MNSPLLQALLQAGDGRVISTPAPGAKPPPKSLADALNPAMSENEVREKPIQVSNHAPTLRTMRTSKSLPEKYMSGIQWGYS